MKITPARRRCPVEFTIDVVCGKYKPLLMWHLKDATMRFNELRRCIPDASPKMITQHLRELEGDGLVRRKVYAVVPPKVEYSLTRTGMSVIPVLEAMCEWGTKYQPKMLAAAARKAVARA